MRSSRTVRSATRLVTAAALCSALVLPVLSGAGPAGADRTRSSGINVFLLAGVPIGRQR